MYRSEVLRDFIDGLEDRLIAFLFWCAVFVPILLGTVTIAHRYEYVDIDMLAGSNAPEGTEGEWMSIGPSLASWTPATPPPTEVVAVAEGKEGGDGQDGEAKKEGGEAEKPVRPGATGGQPRKGTEATDSSDPGSGKGIGDYKGPGTLTRPMAGAGGVEGKKKDCLPPDPRIRKVSESDYAVDREILDYYARHLKEFDDLAFTTPHFDLKGDPDGFRVSSMRCGNPLVQGGLKNGDIIHSINGKRVTNMMQAASAYMKLRDEDHLKLEITRKTLPFTLDIDVE